MLGEKIKELRQKNKVSQQSLADFLGVGQSAVAMWEKGKNHPEYNTLLKIAEFFQVGTDYLSGGKGAKSAYRIPVLGYVRAGIPTEAVEEILDYEDVVLSENQLENTFALRIKGDSMAPRMVDGDTVIVRKQSDFVSGDICVALVGNSNATVKKIIKKDSGIILMPLNGCYEPLFFTPEDVVSIPVSIIGKVTELRAKI